MPDSTFDAARAAALDDEDRELTINDFGDDEDLGRAARYYKWLEDDGSIPLSERCGF